MVLNRRHCLAILGILFSLTFRLQESIEQDGYEFPVYSTDFCPRNETEWKEKSKVLNCTEQKGYTCLPNENLTELLEFCYTDPWILIEEGLCLYLIKTNSLVNGYSCHNFQYGCPTSSYISTELYKYPSCTLIENGCFHADEICKRDSSTKYMQIKNEKIDWSVVATVLGVMFNICVIIMLSLYYRRKIPFDKRNTYTEENTQFILEQCDKLESKAQDVQNMKSKSTRLAVAAFEFGASYSGCTFSLQWEWRRVKAILPKKDFIMRPRKAPMTLLLNPDQSFCAFGDEAEDIFSKMAQNGSESDNETNSFIEESCSDYYYFEKFTMFLHEKEKLHRDIVLKDLAGKPMKAMDILAIYIKYLKDALLKEINNCSNDFQFVYNDIDFVLVVPASCGDGAKMFMHEAAIQAGLKANQLTIAFKEEAALIYCRHMHLENPKLSLLKRNEYMVVDIGEVHADIAVHKEDENGTLEEIILAHGGEIGEISVNEEIEKFIETFGGKGIMKLHAEVDKEEFLTMLKTFEAKRYNQSEYIFRIHVPFTLDALIKQKYRGGIREALQRTIYKDSVTFEQSKLCISNSVYKTFFQKAINDIINFIEEILTRTDAKDIIIIGRFADCEIIKQSLLKSFKTYRIVIPTEPGLVVMKGAVYFGHISNTKSIRFARYTYGVGMKRQYRSEKNEDKKQCDIKELSLEKHGIYPLVRRGEEIKSGFEYHVSHSLKTGLGKVDCELYVSDQENPTYTDEKGCKLLGKILVQLPIEENGTEIKEGIVFDETEIIFRVRLDSGHLFETSFDLLDEKNLPIKIN